MRKLKRDDEGIALVLMTIAMTALLACASLAIDIGQTAASARSVQNSADAAALAAANDCAAASRAIRHVCRRTATDATATCNTARAQPLAHARQDGRSAVRNAHASRPSDRPRPSGARFSLATSVPLAISACDFSTSIIICHGTQSRATEEPSRCGRCPADSVGFEVRHCVQRSERRRDLRRADTGTSRQDRVRLDSAHGTRRVRSRCSSSTATRRGRPYHVGGFAIPAHRLQLQRQRPLAARSPADCPGGVERRLHPRCSSSKYCIQGDFIPGSWHL